jgi:outer membrane protein OmpA-like peptidoglycan-associated protein
MLSWIAVHVEADRIEYDLEQRARSVLRAAGHDWASIVFSGRDGVLVGTARHRHEPAGALALVRGVWGVRTVAGRTRIVGETPDSIGPRQMGARARTLPVPRPLATIDSAVLASTLKESNAAADAQQSQAAPARAAIETAAIANGRTGPAEDCGGAVRTLGASQKVRFARGEAELDGRGRAFLDRLIAVARGCPHLSLKIAGYADAEGQARRNLSLSKHRARAAVTYLLKKGIDARRLEAVGYGEAHPVAPNDTAENRAKNRRIEVEVSDLGSRLEVSSPSTRQGAGNGLPDR